MEGLTRMVVSLAFMISFLTCVVLGKYSRICERLPIHTTTPQSSGDNGYSIQLKGLPEPDKYIPGETYTVLVKNLKLDRQSDGGLLGVMMVAVPQGAADEETTVGNFSTPTHHVKLANCDHDVVVHHYLDEKSKIKVDWQAPSSGCVEFRATVITVDHTKWFKDNGGLTFAICPQEPEPEMNKQSDAGAKTSPQCCACGEARYKMVFEGLWSRQTHPKDFPTGRDAVLLHWSNIIGATHTDDYYIWEYGGYAERGVREVCEYGYSTKLEADMKLNSDNIYTVIKTSPMWRDVTVTRESVFKVNQKAHLLSLLTMVGPSPDWCIGIPSLSMCQTNCTWADSMTVELYPWDAGTDDGVTYINRRKTPTDPPDRIHRITNSYPRHPDSPFYGGAPVKPMATVTLTKLREWCDEGDNSRGTDDPIPSTDDLVDMMKKKMMLSKKLEMMKCATTEWEDWTECSNNCGVGMRQRSREMQNENVLPSMCSVELMQKEQCQGKCMESVPSKQGRDKLSDNFEIRHTLELDLNDPCVVTPWSDWSPCSAKQCGRGVRERWRMFLRKSAQMMNCGVSIMEKDLCYGPIRDCRKAEMMKNFSAICSLPSNDGPCRGNFQRWYYDRNMRKCLPFRYGGCRGNDNRFETEDDCRTRCADYMDSFEESLRLMNKAELTATTDHDINRMMKKKMMATQKGSNSADTSQPNFSMRKKRKMMKRQRKMEKEKQRARRRLMKSKNRNGKGKSRGDKIDCMVTEWTEWGACTETCGKHYVTRSRMIKLRPQNGGKKCPKKLSRRRKCKLPKCPRDCKVTDWSDWTSCTATCGQDAVRERRRRVMVKPKFGGMDCPSPTERESCNLKQCSDDKEMKEFMEKMQAHPPHY